MQDKFKPKCINHNLEFVLYIIKNGSKRLIKQCLCCGEKQMQNYKLNSVKNINEIPLYSLDLWNKYKDNQSLSKNLYYEAKNERYEEYVNYINSDKWQLLRKQVIKEYDGKCFFCWEKGTDVHHKTYANFGNEPLSDLVLLCRKCHEEEHINNPTLRYVKQC
jgi:hypothetical protein